MTVFRSNVLLEAGKRLRRGERKGKVTKNLDFYYASGKEEGPRKGR